MYSEGTRQNPQIAEGLGAAVPPPPPPNLQQQAASAHSTQPRPSMYQHGPPSMVGQVPHVGVANLGQSRLPPPPPLQSGSSRYSQMYQTALQNLRYPSQYGNANLHLPPPPPSHGQALHGAPVLQPLEHPGGSQRLQQMSPGLFSISHPPSTSVESHSPADSDMEMEDDITQPSNDQGMENSTEGLSVMCGLVHNGSGAAKELEALRSCSAGMEKEVKVIEDPKVTSFAGGEVPANDFTASKDNSAENYEKPCPESDPPLAGIGTKSLFDDTGISLRDTKSKEISVQAIQDDDNKHDKHVVYGQENQSSVNYAAAAEVAASAGEVKKDDDAKNIDSASIPPKVDKFGRLVREGASDSESDDVRYSGRCSRRRRSSSPSRSPPERRRRRRRSRSRSRSRSRRSPWGKRDRGRSRSLSPLSRRSRSRSPRNRNRSRSPIYRNRSRSPTYRHGNERGGDSMRHDKGNAPVCFDFLRGRCRRGASCRYLHQDSEKSDRPRQHRSKQEHAEIPSGTKSSSTREEINHTSKEVLSNRYDDLKSQPGGNIGLKTDGRFESKIVGSADANLQSIKTNIIGGERKGPSIHIDDSHLPKDNNSIQHPSSGPLQLVRPAHMFPNQHSNVSAHSSWASFPPPPHFSQYTSTITAQTVTSVSSQFQQNYSSSRNEFDSQTISRPHPTELPIQSQTGGLHNQTYPAAQEPVPPVSDAMLKTPSIYDVPSQQYGGPSMLRTKDSLPSVPSASFAQNKSNPHPMPYGLQHSQPVSFNSQSGMMGTSSKYSVNSQENNQQTHLPDVGGSRSLSYLNPYASTFEHSLNSNFCSDMVRQENNMSYGAGHDTSFSSSGQQIGTSGSRQVVDRNFLGSGGDQYDPLLDSLEPSSNLPENFDHDPKLEPVNNSDTILGHGGSNNPLNMEENDKKTDAEATALQAYMDNEECGETADVEVGAVENGSPSDPVDDVNIAEGDIEIDQTKSPGKDKTNKESRSMKLFKVAVADFVKEVLKPSWRQGNMSKEAFKTIVKKTVDKVSGAMKGHHVPKSKAKIDQYVDSQQRKLTKLVMGYVEKYVKV